MISRLVISCLIVFIPLFGDIDIVIEDDSKYSNMFQESIDGCIGDEIVVKQKREIKKLKRELKGVLKRLDSMEMSIDSAANIQQDIEDDSDWNYITVTVKRGDTLSKYAKRYYGDRNSYYKIYRANRDKIGKDLMLHIGDRIIIPIEHIKRRGDMEKSLNRVEENSDVLEYNISKRKTSKSSSDKSITLKMIDEVVYIDDNIDSQEDIIFIPLDDN